MLYRKLGKTKEKVSILGFGSMRLPTINSNEKINEEKASEMISYGIDNGINIIDTAYSYHGSKLGNSGNSEIFLGKFLKEGYRDDILLVTKSPTWLMNKKEDFDYYLNEQLKKLQTDQIDIYLMHSLTENVWKDMKNLEVMEFMDNALASGKIKHIGFSSHTDLFSLAEIIDDYNKWEVGLTQMNFIDEQYQSGIKGLEYLKILGIGSMVMEPLRGGRLVENVPKSIMDIWNKSEIKRTPIEWALQYLWNMKSVDCVFSGMSSLEQVKENIEIASKSEVNCISPYDQKIIKEVSKEYMAKKGNECSSCNYCMPCPNGVDIVECFKEYNIAKMFNNPRASAMQYFSLIEEDNRAENCNNCRECIPMCPQTIEIPKELEKVKKLFGTEFNHF